VTGTLFRWMVREEWRLHSHLFGGARFGAFPLVVAALTGVGTWLLPMTGTPMSTVAAGLGLDAGCGRDAVQQ